MILVADCVVVSLTLLQYLSYRTMISNFAFSPDRTFPRTDTEHRQCVLLFFSYDRNILIGHFSWIVTRGLAFTVPRFVMLVRATEIGAQTILPAGYVVGPDVVISFDRHFLECVICWCTCSMLLVSWFDDFVRIVNVIVVVVSIHPSLHYNFESC